MNFKRKMRQKSIEPETGRPPVSSFPADPPRWADRLLEWCCAPHLLEEVQGDLHERFYKRTLAFDARYAKRQYIREVLGFLRPAFLKRKPKQFSSPFLTDMLKNYFKVALRNLWKNKGFSFINIFWVSSGGCLQPVDFSVRKR